MRAPALGTQQSLERKQCRERDSRRAWSHDVPGEEKAFPGGPGSHVSGAESSRMRSEGPPSDSAGPRPLVTWQGHLSGVGGGEAHCSGTPEAPSRPAVEGAEKCSGPHGKSV